MSEESRRASKLVWLAGPACGSMRFLMEVPARLFACSCMFLGMVAAGPAAAQSEPSLARLLSGRPVRDELAEQLGELWSELAKRPGARAAGEALAEAKTALSALSGARDPSERERRRQIAWAALQRLDREVALAELAASVLTLEARAARGQARLAPGAAQLASAARAPEQATSRDAPGRAQTPSALQTPERGEHGAALSVSDASRAPSATLAPDLAARASRAQRAAAEADDPEIKREQDERARLLRAAADAESRRVALERRAERAEQRMAAEIALRAAADRAGLETRRAAQREAAAQRERREAERVFVALVRGRVALDTSRKTPARRPPSTYGAAVGGHPPALGAGCSSEGPAPDAAGASSRSEPAGPASDAALSGLAAGNGTGRAAESSTGFAAGPAGSVAPSTGSLLDCSPLSAAADGGPPDAAEVAAFLLRRAELLLAAASALGAPVAELGEAERRVAAAQAAEGLKGAGRLQRAEQAHAAALRVLGAARNARPAVAAQAADLLARAHERGFSAESRADGILIRVAGAFAPGQSELRPDEVRRLQLLRELLAAFPHGPILIACSADAPGAAGRGLAGTRARRALEQLAPGLSRDRLRAEETSDPSPPAELRVRLPGYAAPAAAPTAQAGP